jgi:signal transduction histidine kinase
MRKILTLILLVAFSATVGFAKDLTDTQKKAKAKQYVEKAVKLVLKLGTEKACKVFTDPKGGFIEGEYYVSHIAFDGKILCHGVKPDLVGKNLWEVKDPNGVLLVQEIAKQAKSTKGEGWASYSWPSPETKLVTPKTTFVKKISGKDELIHVGIYLKK